MGPVVAKVCDYIWVKEGRLDLIDIAILNDALAVQAENERRAVPTGDK